MFNIFPSNPSEKKNTNTDIAKNLDTLIQNVQTLIEKANSDNEFYDNVYIQKLKDRLEGLKKLNSLNNQKLSEDELYQMGLLNLTPEEKKLIENRLKDRKQKMLSSEEMEKINNKNLSRFMKKKEIKIDEDEFQKFVEDLNKRKEEKKNLLKKN